MTFHITKTAICALALAIVAPGSAWADSTVIITAGTAKERNIEKVARSIQASVGTVDSLTLSEIEAGPECITEASCLASAGRDVGVSRVVGVHLSRSGTSFVLLLVAADAVTGGELSRREIAGVKRKSLETMAGQELVDFVASIPPLAPAEEVPGEETPVEETPVEEAPVVEEVPAEEVPAVEEEEQLDPVSDPIPLAEEEQADESYRVELGLGTGVLFPQVSSELETSAGLEFDVGVPVWKSLSLLSAIGYAQPTVDGSRSDPRLADMMYSTETTQRELTWTLGATWRFLKASSRLNAYGGLGARVWLLETLTNGSSGGNSFGENRETSTRMGAAAWGGAEFLIGPGAAVAELDFGGSDLPHLVTGDVSTAAVAIQVGYRLRL